MRRLLFVVVLLAAMSAVALLGGSSAAGQTAPAPGKVVVLKAARLFDGKANAVVSPGVVVVQDGKILAAGTTASAPAGAEIIDLGDATLLPGFIDAHTHLTGEAGGDWRQDRLDALQETIAEQTLTAAVYARRTLLAGFTTVRNVGADNFVDVGLARSIAEAVTLGPRMIASAYALGAVGGHCDDNGWRQGLFPESTPAQGIFSGPAGARQAVRIQHKYGADIIKVCATGGVLSQRDDVQAPQLTQEELDAMVDEAHTLGLKTAAHAHGAEGAKRAIRAGIDSIEHGTFLDDEAMRMMIQRGTYYVATLMAAEGLRERLRSGTKMPADIEAKARRAEQALDATFRKAVQMGVPIAFGTDAGVYPHGRNPEEFAQMVRLGMTPVAALKAAMSVDAKLLGIDDRLGTLEAGKVADVVATPGDPTQNVRMTEQVFFVMKEGVIYKNERAAPKP